MNYVIKQTELFIRALKTCHSIGHNLHCYFSNDGILLLSNYQQYDDVESKKPTFFCYFNSNSFETMQTNSIHYKMPSVLSSDLQIKLQKLNAAMDTVVFELDIKHIYPSLRAFKKQIKKIEIQVYHTIIQLRVIRQFKMIVFFKDNFFTVECPILLLDEVQQMETIRKYMENRKHLDILDVDPELSEYLNDYNQGEPIQLILKRNSIEILTNSQKSKTNLEINSGFLNSYQFDNFQGLYKNINTINIEPNVLTPFHNFGFKMSISKDVNQKPRLFVSQDWNDQVRMILKSITTLMNKIKFISILDDQSNEDDLLEIIAEYENDRGQTQDPIEIIQQSSPFPESVEETQVKKKIKMNVMN